MEKAKDICEPYRYYKQHYGTSQRSEVVNNPCGIDTDSCLSTLVREFSTQNMGDDEELEVEEWIDCSDSSSEDEAYEDGPSGLFTWPDQLQNMQLEQCQKMFAKRAKYAKKCQFAKYRSWAREYFQEYDRD